VNTLNGRQAFGRRLVADWGDWTLPLPDLAMVIHGWSKQWLEASKLQWTDVEESCRAE
jgi:hypothetical protein